MSNFLTRLYDERNDLVHKIEKLDAFLFTDSFNELDQRQQGLLQIQSSAMKTYLMVLAERIILIEQSNQN